MYLVKVSTVHTVTPAQVEARLAEDLPVQVNADAEHILRSAAFGHLGCAEAVFRLWSKRGDVRNGRARVRIVTLGGSGTSDD